MPKNPFFSYGKFLSSQKENRLEQSNSSTSTTTIATVEAPKKEDPRSTSQAVVKFDSDIAKRVASQFRDHLNATAQRATERAIDNMLVFKGATSTFDSFSQGGMYLPTALLKHFLWYWFLLGKPIPKIQPVAEHILSILLNRLPMEIHPNIMRLIMRNYDHIAEEEALYEGDDSEIKLSSRKHTKGLVSYCFNESGTTFLGVEYHVPGLVLTGMFRDTLTNIGLLQFFFYLYVTPQPTTLITSVTQLINIRHLLPFFFDLAIFPIDLYKLIPVLISLGIRASHEFIEKKIPFELITADFFDAVNELFIYIQPFINLEEPEVSLLNALKYVLFLHQVYPYLNENNQRIADSQDGMRAHLLALLKQRPSLLSFPQIEELYHLISGLPSKPPQEQQPAPTHSSTASGSSSKKITSSKKTSTKKPPSSKKEQAKAESKIIDALMKGLEKNEAEHLHNKDENTQRAKRRQQVYLNASSRHKKRVELDKKIPVDEKPARLRNYKKQLGEIYNNRAYHFIFTEHTRSFQEMDHKTIRWALLRLTRELIQKNDEPYAELKAKLKTLLFTLIDEKKCQAIPEEKLYFNILYTLLYSDRRDILASNDESTLIPIPQQDISPVKKVKKFKKAKKGHRHRQPVITTPDADTDTERSAIKETTEREDELSQERAQALIDVYEQTNSVTSDQLNTVKTPSRTSPIEYYRVVAYHVPFFYPHTLSYTTQIYHCSSLSVQYIKVQDGAIFFCGKSIVATQDLKGIATLLGYFDMNGVYIATGVETVRLREKDSTRFKVMTHQLNFSYPIYRMPSSLQHYTIINGIPYYYAPLSIQEASFLQTQSIASQYCSIAHHIIYKLTQGHNLFLPINYLDLLYHVANFQLNSKIELAQQLDPVYLGVVLCCMDEALVFSAICDFIEYTLNYNDKLYAEFLTEFEVITNRLQNSGPIATDSHDIHSTPMRVEFDATRHTVQFTSPPDDPLSPETKTAWDLHPYCERLNLEASQKDWVLNFFDQLYRARPHSHQLISKENYLCHYCRLETALSELSSEFTKKFPDQVVSLVYLLAQLMKPFPELIKAPVIPVEDSGNVQVNEMLAASHFNQAILLLTQSNPDDFPMYIAEVLQIFSADDAQEFVGTALTIFNLLQTQLAEKTAFSFPLLINNHYCVLFIEKKEDDSLIFTWCNPKPHHPIPELLLLALENIFSLKPADLHILEQSLQNEHDGLYCGTAVFSAIVFASQQIENNLIQHWLDFPLRLLASTTQLTTEARWDVYLTPKQTSLRKLHVDMIRHGNAPAQANHFFELFKTLIISDANEVSLPFGTRLSESLETLFNREPALTATSSLSAHSPG